MTVEVTKYDRMNPRRRKLLEEDQARQEQIAVARTYYAGAQYDATNRDEAEAWPDDRVPEHRKLLAYSTQIQECVDYVASQLSEGFLVTSEDPLVNEIVSATLSNSPDLASDDDEESVNVTAEIRDALIAGDIAVRVKWDPVREAPGLEFWESESVDFQFDPDDRFRMERVVLTETVWVDTMQGMIEVERTREWSIHAPTGQCIIETFEDGEPAGTEFTGLPFIPWRMWRAQRKKIRQARGDSLITGRVQGLAQRYDAVEQLAFLIGRYNSHGNLAVIGDGALLQTTEDARIRKDVADVLTFPGGTGLEVITLPTDPAMIEHQRKVILDALFSAFGVTRMDSESLHGMGQLSGYALEILNRKTDGTFGQIAKQFMRDIRSTLNLAIDVWAVKTNEPEGGFESSIEIDEEGVRVLPELPDPDEIVPDRKMRITLGRGYVIDDARLRDDFTSGLVSRRYALRQRGLSDDDIDDIEEQLADEKPQQPEVNLSTQAQQAVLAVERDG